VSAVLNIYTVTKELCQLCQSAPENEARDSYIDRVEGLLTQRQSMLLQVQPPFSAEEQQLGKEIVKMNKIIDEQLEKRKEEVSKDIRHLKQKEQQANKYVNPYENLSFDGTFYDKRK
jgi:flagellar protein FliT